MKNKLFYLILITLFAIDTFGQSNVNYLRTNSYGSQRLSLEALKKIMLSIQYYSNEEIKDSLNTLEREYFSVELSKKDKALSLSSFDQLLKLNLDGESYTYLFLFYESHNKPISNIAIQLNGDYRKLSVSGNDEKKVEALYRDIDMQLENCETTFSWINWELVFSQIALWLFVIALLGISLTAKYTFSNFSDKMSLIIFLLSVFCCIGLILFMISPISFKDIIPRFILTPDNSNWLVRNAIPLGLIGSIITIITFIRGIFILFRNALSSKNSITIRKGKDNK